MTNGLSFSYILEWLRKTPGGKAQRSWWSGKDYIFIETRPDGGKDVWGMSDTDEGPQKHPFFPHSSDMLTNDWVAVGDNPIKDYHPSDGCWNCVHVCYKGNAIPHCQIAMAAGQKLHHDQTSGYDGECSYKGICGLHEKSEKLTEEDFYHP